VSEERLLPPNIVITGAWRSGTTLLYLLFPHAFADVCTTGGESDALETLLSARFRWRVSKRPNDIHRIRSIVASFDPYFIYMLRDPRDCIVSWREERNGYYMAFNEWLRNRTFAESVGSAKLVTIKFEDLILRPNSVQDLLTRHIGGLEVKRQLDDCFTRMDELSPITFQLCRGVRPAAHSRANQQSTTVRRPDPSVIGVWRNDKSRIREQLDSFPELQAALEKYGYEVDNAWQAELAE